MPFLMQIWMTLVTVIECGSSGVTIDCLSHYGDNIPSLEEISMQLVYWATPYLKLERSQSGEEFPLRSLHHILCVAYTTTCSHCELQKQHWSLQRQWFCWFSCLLGCRDEKITKSLSWFKDTTGRATRYGWRRNPLAEGLANPQASVDTMHGISLALRSNKEHRQLRSDLCHITLNERSCGRPYIEDVSNNTSGGLKGWKIKPKIS